MKVGTLDEALEDQGLKCLVFGDPGIGKTVLSATTGANTLIINAEGGLLSLKDVPEEIKKDITVATVSTTADLDGVLQMLKVENPFVWVILDSVSEIAEVCLSEEKANVNDGRAAYGNLADIIYKLLRSFRDLPSVNVMMTSKMQLVEVQPGKTRFGPLMPGRQLTQGVSYLFDEVFAMLLVNDSDGVPTRVLQTAGDLQYACKDRSGKLDFYELPDLGEILIKSGLGKFKKEEIAKTEESTEPTTNEPENTNEDSCEHGLPIDGDEECMACAHESLKKED